MINISNIRIFAFLCVMSLLCLAMSCGDEFDIIWKIDNRTDESLLFYYNHEVDITVSDMLETVHYHERPQLVLPHEVYEFGGSYDGYQGILSILIIKERTLKSYSMDELIENNIYDAKFLLTTDEFKEMNYTIVYTGNENNQ